MQGLMLKSLCVNRAKLLKSSCVNMAIMSYFKTINACHNHNVRMKNCNFKIKFSRTTKQSEYIKRPLHGTL